MREQTRFVGRSNKKTPPAPKKKAPAQTPKAKAKRHAPTQAPPEVTESPDTVSTIPAPAPDVCPCEGESDDPGTGHIATCEFADPDHDTEIGETAEDVFHATADSRQRATEAVIGDAEPIAAIHQTTGNGWTVVNGDCVEVARAIPSASIDFSIYSPPFASLYTYSNSDRDMGNCTSHDQFHEHFRFLLAEMLRVTKPGRNMSVHCMDLPTSKVRDKEIGLADFPGEIIRSARAAGWIWHSKVTIRKDPVTAMQRTKALGLLHKQVLKDSAMSRMGIPDYVLTFRRPGVNAEPVAHARDEFPVTLWQQWAEPIWSIADSDKDLELLAQFAGLTWDDIDPSDTLQFRSAREHNDERHICPLQLEVIRRCLRLWSNPGDIVLSPFAGIGSELVVALEEGRRVVGVELKQSYYEQNVRNCAKAEPAARGKQVSLFGEMGGASG